MAPYAASGCKVDDDKASIVAWLRKVGGNRRLPLHPKRRWPEECNEPSECEHVSIKWQR